MYYKKINGDPYISDDPNFDYSVDYVDIKPEINFSKWDSNENCWVEDPERRAEYYTKIFRNKRDRFFNETDYITIRHYEETLADIPTTLNEQDYLKFIAHKNILRKLTDNVISDEVNILTLEQIFNL